MKVILTKSTRKNKKFRAFFPEKRKTVHFGDSRYDDYTMHKTPGRKASYLARHKNRENWQNPFSAGFWSRWLLWNKHTKKISIDDIERRFDLEIQHDF